MRLDFACVSRVAQLLLALLPLQALAAEYQFGINAEVSYSESAADVKHRYAAFLDDLGKDTGNKFIFSPVYSDQVEQAIATKRYDFLLIHTHAALRAERKSKYQVVGFTDDRKNNSVHFFVRPDSPIRSLTEVARTQVGSPGMQSWAVATARAALRDVLPDVEVKFVTTRIQDAVPLMVELKRTPVGISRSKKLVDDYAKQNRLRVVHSTPPLPLNALIASPDIAPELIAELRAALTSEARPKVFEPLAFKGLRYTEPEAQRLRSFFR